MYGSVGQRGKILNVLQMISLICTHCTVLLQVSPHFYPQVEKLCQ